MIKYCCISYIILIIEFMVLLICCMCGYANYHPPIWLQFILLGILLNAVIPSLILLYKEMKEIW